MQFSAIDWQKKIYLQGFAGSRPVIPTDSAKLELLAKVRMTTEAFAYVAGGAGSEQTMKANRAAFDECKLVPRMLRNVSERDTRLDLLGMTLPSPVILAPVGVLELVHRDADLAASRAAAELRLPFIFSNQASYPMERCAQGMGDSPRWFQLYWSKSHALVASLVQRAEKCGCSAIVVTLDTTMLGWRPRDLDLGYLPFLEGKGIAQYTSDPVFQKIMDEPPDAIPERTVNFSSIQGLITMVNRYPGRGFFGKLRSGKPIRAVQKFVSKYSNPATTWDDLKFLREQTGLKLILKGVLHPEDARMALDHGVDGIIVSNHGGRQVDGSIATLSALPGIVTAVNGKIPVILDSGVRGGADIFKALAHGAKAVCVGRPYVYGLAIAGQQGVEDVLRNFMTEFELTMGLTGCKSLSDIHAEMLAQQ